MVGCNAVDHGFSDLRVVKLVGPVVVMLADLCLHEAPVGKDFRVNRNNHVAHINQSI